MAGRGSACNLVKLKYRIEIRVEAEWKDHAVENFPCYATEPGLYILSNRVFNCYG